MSKPKKIKTIKKKYTFNMAKKVYACESIPVADAYKCLSKAYALNKFFKDDLYYEYAQKCLKIAQDYFPPPSPKLIPYQACLSKLKIF